jgi:hypothetical protein
VFFIVLLASALCCSCRTVRVIEQVPVEVHDTTYVAKTTHDSTYIDRWHTVEVKGDTVYVTEQQIVSKWRTITDTVYKYIEKPVTVEVEQIKEVAKPLSWWQKTLMWSGVAALVVLLAVLLAKFWQLFRR